MNKNDMTEIKCPECKGTGKDTSERPVVFIITTDKHSDTVEAPCAMCFGHGTIRVRDESAALHGETKP